MYLRRIGLTLGLTVTSLVGVATESFGFTINQDAGSMKFAAAINGRDVYGVALEPLTATMLNPLAQNSPFITLLNNQFDGFDANGTNNAAVNWTFNTGAAAPGAVTISQYDAQGGNSFVGAGLRLGYDDQIANSTPTDLRWIQIYEAVPNGIVAPNPSTDLPPNKTSNRGDDNRPFYYTDGSFDLNNDGMITGDENELTNSNIQNPNATTDLVFSDFPSVTPATTVDFDFFLYLTTWDGVHGGTVTIHDGLQWGYDASLLFTIPQLPLPSNQPGPTENKVPSPDEVPGKEYSNSNDINDTGTADPEQTLNWDTDPPTDAFDFSGTREGDSEEREVDALAYPFDHLFEEVTQNQVPLLFSTDGDSRIFFERTDGSFGIWAEPPLATDVDGLEVWDEEGEFGRSDAYIYSLEGDPDVGNTGAFGRISVWGFDDNLIDTVPYLTAFQVADAIGRPDLADSIDLDAMMMLSSFDSGIAEWLFSIAPIDGFDGGEIWVWDGVTQGGAEFLNHGGHIWDTAFCVQCTFGTASENINALEAVAATPEPTNILGLFALGSLGAASTLKRKLKYSKEKELEKIS